MNNFNQFLQELLDHPSSKTTLRIYGEQKKIRGLARFSTANYPNDEYIKIVFEDHSFVLILPKEQEVYYADKVLEKAKGITDEMIGRDKGLKFNGKTYELGNKNDYQFCLQLYVGTPKDIEGECRFSDYFPTEGPKEFLSLGWLSHTGERADIRCQIIDLTDIDIISNDSND